jgi:hypothetical protein
VVQIHFYQNFGKKTNIKYIDKKEKEKNKEEEEVHICLFFFLIKKSKELP